MLNKNAAKAPKPDIIVKSGSPTTSDGKFSGSPDWTDPMAAAHWLIMAGNGELLLLRRICSATSSLCGLRCAFGAFLLCADVANLTYHDFAVTHADEAMSQATSHLTEINVICAKYS